MDLKFTEYMQQDLYSHSHFPGQRRRRRKRPQMVEKR